MSDQSSLSEFDVLDTGEAEEKDPASDCSVEQQSCRGGQNLSRLVGD